MELSNDCRRAWYVKSEYVDHGDISSWDNLDVVCLTEEDAKHYIAEEENKQAVRMNSLPEWQDKVKTILADWIATLDHDDIRYHNLISRGWLKYDDRDISHDMMWNLRFGVNVVCNELSCLKPIIPDPPNVNPKQYIQWDYYETEIYSRDENV